MKTSRKSGLFVAVLSFFCMLSLASCQKEEETIEPVAAEKKDLVSMEEVAVIDYTIPQVNPGILINCEGFNQHGAKTAYFIGETIPEEFVLIDSATGQSVYSGPVTVKEDSNQARYGLGDFTQFEELGEYYLYASYLGESRRFKVEEDYYQNSFSLLYENLKEKCRREEAFCSELTELLVAYEWYGDLFLDQDGNRIPDVLEMTAGWIEKTTFTNMESAAFLAKFSYLYKSYDWRFATNTLKKATALYEENSKEAGTDADTFFALTELYRATGKYAYRTAIAGYADYLQKNASCFEKSGYLYGAVTYISTHQKVDVDLCKTLLNSIVDKARENVSYFNELISPLQAKNNGVEDLIAKTGIVMAANYINNNYEYNRIIARTWNYYCGQNENSRNFLESAMSKKGFLLIAAQLDSVEDNHWTE